MEVADELPLHLPTITKKLVDVVPDILNQMRRIVDHPHLLLTLHEERVVDRGAQHRLE